MKTHSDMMPTSFDDKRQSVARVDDDWRTYNDTYSIHSLTTYLNIKQTHETWLYTWAVIRYTLYIQSEPTERSTYYHTDLYQLQQSIGRVNSISMLLLLVVYGISSTVVTSSSLGRQLWQHLPHSTAGVWPVLI